MRKIAALGLAGVLLLVTSAPALATSYYVPLPRAKHIAREEAKALCNGDAKCLSYGWGCQRAGHGAKCLVSTTDEATYGEIRCDSILHLTIGAGGYIQIRYGGEPHCYYLE